MTLFNSSGDGRIAWVAKARCRSSDPDELFVRGAAQRKAAVICRHCPVAVECLADALDNQMEFGVWGGMTERQRRALLKRHREVESWSDFLAVQRHLLPSVSRGAGVIAGHLCVEDPEREPA
jgi:WhiB family redox-sensing transcriptional regulator